ncbi:MAG TPA: hypothetical protein VK915_06910 [Gaiellaceae bacterium]|nr:hypothetical protein [Gaiellaceae bacterium]
MRRLALCPLLLALALAACGGDGEEGAPTEATTEDAAPATTTEPATTVAPTETEMETEPAEPEGPPFGTSRAAGPASGGSTALLTAVRLGRNEGFDRVVFEFRPGATPGYRVRYVRPPIREDGSGRRIEVDGDAFLSVRMEPASGFDLTGEGELVYTGPTRLDGDDVGAEVVEEVVRTGDFEAVLNWVAGLDERVPFRVFVLSGPPRVVVDVRTG